MEYYDEDKEYMRELLERFEKSTGDDGYSFFDSGELEDIIYYYFAENNQKKALLAIDFAIRSFPLETAFQVFKAQYFLNSGEPEKALVRLNKLAEAEPTNADVVLTRASALSSLNKHKEAIAEYLYALELVDEDLDEVHTSISYEYQILGNFRKGAEHLEKAISINPENESLLFEIGYCFEEGLMHEEAVAYFVHLTDQQPYSRGAWYNLGLAYNELGLFEKAIDAFDFAMAIDPKYLAAYFSKAQCYEQMDMFQEAINVYKETFETEKPDAMTCFYVGDCYANLGKFETAIDYFRKSISLERHFPDVWMGLGISFIELGQTSEGIAHMEQALKIESDNPDLYLLMAQTCASLGSNDKAITAFAKAAELNPMHPEVWLDYSEIYAEKGDYTKAIELIDDGIFYQPDNSVLSYRRVAYMYESGLKKEAIIELFIALTMDFDGHVQLLDYSESISNSTEILTAIASFRNYTGLKNNN